MNLHHYINSHDFLADLNSNTKHIIISDDNLGPVKRNIQRYTFADLFARKIDKKEFSDSVIICIAHSLMASDMILIDELLPFSHNWISLDPGVMSIYRKSMPEQNDIITMLTHHYQVYEPVSTTDFLYCIYKEKSYIRMHDILLAKKLDQKDSSDTVFISGSQDHSELTILANISAIDHVASAIHTVTQGSSNMFDLFARRYINKNLSDELKDSIARTQRILVVLDHKATEEIWLFLDNLIQQECGNDITIQYLFPQYHLVSSILPEYILEEAKFDEIAISDFLGSIIAE